jgi:hypothetical protein
VPDDKLRLAHERLQRRRLRLALREGLRGSSPQQSLEVLLGSIACVMDHSDPRDCAAYDMACTAVSAIVTKHDVLRDVVHRWDEHRRMGRSQPDPNTVVILRIASLGVRPSGAKPTNVRL